MMKFLIPPKIIWVICVVFMLVFILIFNPLLVKMFFGKNQFNSGVNDENVMAQLVYTWNGYEIIISGNGNMSDYTCRVGRIHDGFKFWLEGFYKIGSYS